MLHVLLKKCVCSSGVDVHDLDQAITMHSNSACTKYVQLYKCTPAAEVHTSFIGGVAAVPNSSTLILSQ